MKRNTMILLLTAMLCLIIAGCTAPMTQTDVAGLAPIDEIEPIASPIKKRTAPKQTEFSNDALSTDINVGAAGNTAIITEAEAKAVALKHADLTDKDVTFVSIKLDRDHGRTEYEVEFYKNNTEYDYEIDATTGTILSFDHEAEHYTAPSVDRHHANDGATNSAHGVISQDDAKCAALSHAGLSENAVSGMHVEFDRDDGHGEYEVEFYMGNTEYSYDIDAVTGVIKSVDIDHD